MQINKEVFYKLILSFRVCGTRDAQSTQNKFAYLCNISRKAQGKKLIFCLKISTKAFYKLVVSLCVYVARHAQNTQNIQSASLPYLCNISRKTLRMKLIFCLQINVKCFFKVILSFQVCLGRHAQIIKNNKLAISLQYFKKEVSDEVDFLIL